MSVPPLVLTCGDPAGIGPEIAVKAWAYGDVEPFLWLGDPRHLPPGTKVSEIADPAETAQAARHGLPVLRHDFPHPTTPSQPDPANASAVVAVIERAVTLVQEGQAAGITTAPISKKVLIEGAGFAFPGHTEFLAQLGGSGPVAMMLACPELRVVPTTIHIPLNDVASALTPALLETTLRTTHHALIQDFGVKEPRIAVAGLNPHAGEGGAMGQEDDQIIAP
ncbi:MAG: 4-hydroxythreonine-4-phosphate dehydrogenase PdxA, partial [Pseudomonadota bacterium]